MRRLHDIAALRRPPDAGLPLDELLVAESALRRLDDRLAAASADDEWLVGRVESLVAGWRASLGSAPRPGGLLDAVRELLEEQDG